MHVEGYIFLVDFTRVRRTNSFTILFYAEETGRESFFVRQEKSYTNFPGISDAGRKEEERERG